MSKQYWYVVQGINPVPWTSPTVTIGRKKGKPYPQVYASAELKNYKQAVSEEVQDRYPDAPLIEDEIALRFFFWRKIDIDSGRSRKVQSNYADATNLQKSTEDALQGILFKNDRQVVHAESWIMAQTDATEPLIVVGIEWHPKRPQVDVESGLDLFGEEYQKVVKSDVRAHIEDPEELF